MTAITHESGLAGLSCYPTSEHSLRIRSRAEVWRIPKSAVGLDVGLLVLGWLDVFWNRRKDQARDSNCQPPATPNTRSGRRGKLPIQVTTPGGAICHTSVHSK